MTTRVGFSVPAGSNTTWVKKDTTPPSETEAFTIGVPANLVGKAVPAALGVPVLVN